MEIPGQNRNSKIFTEEDRIAPREDPTHSHLYRSPDLVAEGDRLFASHAKWMRNTHARDGEKALLLYNLVKGPELSNPMDPSSKPTGNTCFVLTEVYETPAGVADHWKQLPAWEEVAGGRGVDE